jgi:nucleoid-associated protein YgaU
MADGAVNGVRIVIGLAVAGAVAVAGGYMLWQGRQAPMTDGAAADDAAVVSPAEAPAAMANATEEAAPAAPETVTPQAVVTEAATPEPATPEALTDASEPMAPAVPTFDVVRIEADGSTLIAGSAPPDSGVSLRLDGVEEVRVQAGGDGAFVAQFTLAPNPAPRLLSMAAVLDDGTEVAANKTVAVAPIAASVPVASAQSDPAPAAAPEPPTAILLSDEGAAVVQGPTTLIDEGEKVEVSLDAIAYAPDGEVQLSGRGQADSALRIYLDNAAVMETTTAADGKWAVTLPTTIPGIYTLRIDQMGPEGAVVSRFETPFKRETLEALAVASVATMPAPEETIEPNAPDAAAETAPTAALKPVAPAVQAGAPDLAIPEPAAAVAPAALATVNGAGSDDAANPAAEPAVTAEPVADAISAALPTATANNPVEVAPVQAPVTVTVQPGFTLWGIATERFGAGTMYVQVFEANRNSIKDPDLIYPGQVFTLPQE